MSGKYFKGKNAVITGAASGIGRSFALQLADFGTNLVISDINMERLAKVKEEITQRGGTAIALMCDVTDATQTSNLAKNAIGECRDIHFLFSNAGIASGGLFPYITTSQWDNIIKINVWGMINTITAFIPKMLEQGFGHVIQTSSIAGSIGVGGLIPYSTTKFANAGFCEALYGECRDKGINVSIICPFPLKTNLIENAGVGYPPELENGYDQDVVAKAFAAGKAHYWNEFTKRAFITSGFGGGMDVDFSVKKYLKAIQKKRLYIFENRLGRLFQCFRGLSPLLYTKIIRILGKRHCRLISDTYKLAVDEAKLSVAPP
ncbi:MAG TPA: SDR family oxidoreductase [Candidatus Lokiarchaeia archaeon]|nr:SDR family oxidoreductase [Candidatus Lokiarchaeia archaeon]